MKWADLYESGAAEIADGLQRLIGRLDRLTIQFKSPLRLDEGNKLFHRIDIGAFKESGLKETGSILTRGGLRWLPGGIRLRINAAAQNI